MTSKSSSTSTSGGVGLLGLLGILFVGLKLTGYIDWSWWYVTMPFWGAFALVIVIVALCLLGWLLTKLLNSKR
ncbi:hypothetical protein [Pseudomonas rhizophila]|uniref:hypothetical protein n=1 Tax=Pseudomonas rhizophila TaxID=2045200 RepID=UPI0030D9803D